jgi:hypothetical protein
MKLTPIAANMTELELTDGTTVFFSYKTPVAGFIPGQGVFRTEEFFSQTTSKHINKWIRMQHPDATQTIVSQKKIERFVEPI